MTLLTRARCVGLVVVVPVLAGCGSTGVEGPASDDIAPAQAYIDLVLGSTAEQAAAQAMQAGRPSPPA